MKSTTPRILGGGLFHALTSVLAVSIGAGLFISTPAHADAQFVWQSPRVSQWTFLRRSTGSYSDNWSQGTGGGASDTHQLGTTMFGWAESKLDSIQNNPTSGSWAAHVSAQAGYEPEAGVAPNPWSENQTSALSAFSLRQKFKVHDPDNPVVPGRAMAYGNAKSTGSIIGTTPWHSWLTGTTHELSGLYYAKIRIEGLAGFQGVDIVQKMNIADTDIATLTTAAQDILGNMLSGSPSGIDQSPAALITKGQSFMKSLIDAVASDDADSFSPETKQGGTWQGVNYIVGQEYEVQIDLFATVGREGYAWGKINAMENGAFPMSGVAVQIPAPGALAMLLLAGIPMASRRRVAASR